MSQDAEQDPLTCINCGGAVSDEQQDTGLCADCLPLLSLPDLEPETEVVEPPRRVLNLFAPEGLSKEAAAAMLLLRPTLQGAITIDSWLGQNGAGQTINTLADELSQQVNDVIETGDMGRCEALLVTQAHVLDVVANNLLTRAANADYLSQTEVYTKLGLRAQAQCRATVEALASVRSPAPPVLKQTNISAGPQQVNNRLESNASNELSAIESDTPVETVAKFDRATNTSRQGAEQPQ